MKKKMHFNTSIPGFVKTNKANHQELHLDSTFFNPGKGDREGTGKDSHVSMIVHVLIDLEGMAF